MRYKEGDYEAVHENPCWRHRADFIFAVYLGCQGQVNEWEQLWGESFDEKKFLVCCIPFFANGIALGDIIETDDDYVFTRVDIPSGNFTIRIWLKGQPSNIRESLISQLRAFNAQLEWSSKNLLALNVKREIFQDVVTYLNLQQESGLLQYEVGNDNGI